MYRDALLLGFRTAQMTIDASLAGVSHEESIQQPVQAGNCMNWVAGHILATREGLKGLLGVSGESPLNEAETARYKQGSSPLEEGSAAIRLDRILKALQDQNSAILAKIESLSDQELDTDLDPKSFPMPVPKPSLASYVTLFLYHEAYHSGQLSLGRRLLGKASGMGI